MEWYMATKLAFQSLFDERFKKVVLIIIAIFIGIAIMMFSIVSLPVILLNLPQTAFQSKEEADKTNGEYVNIMVEYKYKIHRELASRKKEFNSNDIKVTKIKANYPSLSILIAYDNVLNKNRYKEEVPKIVIDKKKIFSFLDTCMIYDMDNEVFSSHVKSAEEIASINFENEEDKNMFISIYNTLKKTDLDNTVPDIKFSDLEYLEGGIELPYFNQYDKRWAYDPYGQSTIWKSGCGIASMCMILNGLIPDLNLLPPELANWSNSNGYYIYGSGTAWSIFPRLAKDYGLNIKNLSRDNPQSILNELSKGHPIVVSVSPGHFTNGGHFIVLRGITPDGQIIVSDPASLERSQKTWDYSIILTESSTLSPYSFWSFSK